MLASEPGDYAHHNVLVASSTNKLTNGDFFIEDCITAVNEEGSMYLHLTNLTEHALHLRKGTVIGKAAVTELVFEPMDLNGAKPNNVCLSV